MEEEVTSSGDYDGVSNKKPPPKRSQVCFLGDKDPLMVKQELNEKLDRFQQSIVQEKNSIKAYDDYLQSVLDEGEDFGLSQQENTHLTPYLSRSRTVLETEFSVSEELSFTNKKSLNQSLLELDASIQCVQNADEVFEIKLKALMLDLD